MSNQIGFKGIAFPFGFSSSGSTKTSETNENDLAHIEEEIYQRLLTRKGERVFRPDYGSDVYKVLHRPQDDTTIGLIKEYTRQALEPMSDRIQVISIDVEYQDADDLDKDSIVIVTLDIFVTKYLTGDILTINYDTSGGE